MKQCLFAGLLCLLLLLSGCGSKVPEHLRNSKTEFLRIENYRRADYPVPPNYRLIKNGIYAVLDEDGNITGFMKLVEEDGGYRWEESNAEEACK